MKPVIEQTNSEFAPTNWYEPKPKGKIISVYEPKLWLNETRLEVVK